MKNLNENVFEDIDYALVADKLLNKHVIYKDKDYTVSNAESDEDDVTLTLKSDDEERILSANVVFDKDLVSSDDEEFLEVKAMFKKENAPEEVSPDEDEEETFELSEYQQGVAKAREDFFAKPKVTSYYKELSKVEYFQMTDFEKGYYDEFTKLSRSPIASKSRRLSQTVASTYKGDVDELIDWLRSAITSISITDSPDTRNGIEKFLDELNQKRGTHYEASHSSNKEGASFVANLTDKKEILDAMPEDVLTWAAYKNTGRFGSQGDKELAPVYNKKENTLSCNSIIQDLLINYDFKPGDNKVVKEDVEELPDVIVDTPVIEEPTKEEVDNGMFSVISQEIRDTYQDMENIKSIIATIKDLDNKETVIATLESIVDDRAIHVGMLQSLLGSYDKETSELIDKGNDLVLDEE